MSIFNRKIVSTEILDSYTDSRKSASSSFIRGAVGGALFGGVGALAGGLSGKNKNKSMITFLVKYNDGTQDTQTVKTGSLIYNTYIQFLNK